MVNIVYGDIVFECDEAKANSNLEKHKIGFDEAILVFFDEFALQKQDRIENGEWRWQTLRMVGGVMVLLVAHTWIDLMGRKPFVLFRHAKLQNRKKECMSKIITKIIKVDNPPTLTQAQLEKLRALSFRDDCEIDLSDMPEVMGQYIEKQKR